MRAVAWAAPWVLLACATPDADRDGFVLVDEAARAAGVRVDVEGTDHEGATPVAVPEGSGAHVVRRGQLEPLIVGPGELVEIVGPDGQVRRSPVPRDAFEVRGDADAVRRFAGLMDARVTATSDGQLRISGPDVFVLAALIGPIPGVTGIGPSRLDAGRAADPLDVGFELRPDPGSVELPPEDAPRPDATALVGLYEHGDARVLLDANGGYVLYQGEAEVGRGRYVPRPGGVEFVVPDRCGSTTTTMRLEGDALVDGVGLRLAPVEDR